jgi:hypothetical protein
MREMEIERLSKEIEGLREEELAMSKAELAAVELFRDENIEIEQYCASDHGSDARDMSLHLKINLGELEYLRKQVT